MLAGLTDARLLTVSDGEVELSHEALLREWPRYRTWLEEDRIGRRVHAHLTASAREWDEQGRDAAEVYRGGRLAAALEWRAGHEPELNQTEQAFLDAGRAAAGRAQGRLQMVLAAVTVLLLVAVTGGVVALINQQSASNHARVALARQLGAQAVNEPRLDRAMLLAREAVNLDRSPQTEGTLLATLQRNPAVIGTFALPVELAPQLAVSPDGHTLAVSHFLINHYGVSDDPHFSLGDIRFYDPRTHARERAPVTHFGGAEPPVYSSDGSLLAYPTDNYLPSIAVRDAHTLTLACQAQRSIPSRPCCWRPDIAHASILIAPDGRTVYCAYRVYDLTRSFAKAPGATYLARWSLPSGRRLSTTTDRLGSGTRGEADRRGRPPAGRRRAQRQHVRRAARSAVCARSRSRRRRQRRPPRRSARTARTIALGSQTGQVSFVDPSTGQRAPRDRRTRQPR